MKKSFLQIAVFVASMFLFTTSCTKQPIIPPTPVGDERELTLTLESASLSSKAFFDNTSVADPFELTINNAAIYLVKDNVLYLKRRLTTAEISTKTLTVPLPSLIAGDKVTAYLVCNDTETSTVNDFPNLFAQVDDKVADYNGLFANITTMALRSEGFLMSGSGVFTVASGKTTTLAITVNRTVAKIAVQAATTAAFDTKYMGKLKINSMQISNSYNKTFVLSASTATLGATRMATLLQTSNLAGVNFQNMFYVYPDPSTGAIIGATKLTMNAIYDADGNFTTTGDQKAITYDIDLTGSAGKFIRNGYYRVQLNIDGLVADKDVTTTISVSNWETPITQTASVGK